MTVVDVIVRQEDGGWSVWSPTAPGFYAGDESYEHLAGLVLEGLRDYFDGEDVRVVEHTERVFDDDLILRVCYDEHREDRLHVAARMQSAQWEPEQAERLRDQPRNDLEEHIVVCALSSDTLGFVGRQMAPAEMVYVAVAVADELVLSFRMTNAEAVGSSSLATLGLSLDSPLGEVMRILRIGEDPVASSRTLLEV